MKTITCQEIKAIRLNLILSEKHQQFFKYSRDFQRKISNLIYEWLNGGQVEEIKSFSLIIPEEIVLINGEKSKRETKKGVETGREELGDRQLKYLPEISKIIEDFFGKDYQKTHVDALMWDVFRRYKSYIKRNKKLPRGSIAIRDKAMTFKSNIFKIDTKNNLVLASNMIKDKDNPNIKIDYTYDDHYEKTISLLEFGKRAKEISKPRGGVLALKKNELVLAVNKETSYQKPEVWIGSDINKDPSNWIYFSAKVDGSYCLAKTSDISEVEKGIREMQKRITKDKTINSRQRSGLRKKWKKLHARHKKLVQKVLFPHLEKIVLSTPKRVGMAIDAVGTGDKNGTFGQDKIIELMQTFCRERGIPHYFIPTPYTSQRCNKCGNISKAARCKYTNEYICTAGCGYKVHGDLAGAKNGAEFARALEENGTPMKGTADSNYMISNWSFLKKKYNMPSRTKN